MAPVIKVCLCFFQFHYFHTQNYSSLSNSHMQCAKLVSCVKKNSCFQRGLREMWQESFRKKVYRDVSNLPGQPFVKACIIWMLLRLTCQQQEPKQDGPKSQENNQDRKISHRQLLNNKLAYSHIQSHRLNRNFPS